jgi:nitroreductase
MTDFQELLRRRRSVREYLPDPVDEQTIQALLREATLAPSAGNGQPWRFVVIQNPDVIRRISDDSKANLLAHLANNPDSPLKAYKQVLESDAFNVFYNAPALVMIVGPKNLRTVEVDCALAAAYFMMAAADRSLGTCWVDLGSAVRDPDLLAEIGLSRDDRIVAPIILGWPRQVPDPPPRRAPHLLKIVK